MGLKCRVKSRIVSAVPFFKVLRTCTAFYVEALGMSRSHDRGLPVLTREGFA